MVFEREMRLVFWFGDLISRSEDLFLNLETDFDGMNSVFGFDQVNDCLERFEGV